MIRLLGLNKETYWNVVLRTIYKALNQSLLRVGLEFWESIGASPSLSYALLRAALCNFHLGPCKIEKSKIAKLCHNKGLPKPFIKIQVLIYSGRYFTVTATLSFRWLGRE